MHLPDHYALLDVAPDADGSTIHAAFRRMVLIHHPDLHPGDAAVHSHFLSIVQAHDVLSDPARRAAYDAKWEGKQPATNEPGRRPSFEEWVARYHPAR